MRGTKLKLLAVALLAPALAAGISASSATPALADRCEPEELVLGPNTSPIDERDNPVCAATFFYVYPFVCASDGNNPPPTLLQCPRQVQLNPTYVPPLVPPYNPNVGRAACNLIQFASPTTTCVFTSDPATGNTRVTTSDGFVDIPGLVTAA